MPSMAGITTRLVWSRVPLPKALSRLLLGGLQPLRNAPCVIAVPHARRRLTRWLPRRTMLRRARGGTHRCRWHCFGSAVGRHRQTPHTQPSRPQQCHSAGQASGGTGRPLQRWTGRFGVQTPLLHTAPPPHTLGPAHCPPKGMDWHVPAHRLEQQPPSLKHCSPTPAHEQKFERHCWEQQSLLPLQY